MLRIMEFIIKRIPIQGPFHPFCCGWRIIYSPVGKIYSSRMTQCKYTDWSNWSFQTSIYIIYNLICSRPGILILVNDADWELLVSVFQCTLYISFCVVCISDYNNVIFIHFRENSTTNYGPKIMSCSYPPCTGAETEQIYPLCWFEDEKSN